MDQCLLNSTPPAAENERGSRLLELGELYHCADRGWVEEAVLSTYDEKSKQFGLERMCCIRDPRPQQEREIESKLIRKRRREEFEIASIHFLVPRSWYRSLKYYTTQGFLDAAALMCCIALLQRCSQGRLACAKSLPLTEYAYEVVYTKKVHNEPLQTNATL